MEKKKTSLHKTGGLFFMRNGQNFHIFLLPHEIVFAHMPVPFFSQSVALPYAFMDRRTKEKNYSFYI